MSDYINYLKNSEHGWKVKEGGGGFSIIPISTRPSDLERFQFIAREVIEKEYSSDLEGYKVYPHGSSDMPYEFDMIVLLLDK